MNRFQLLELMRTLKLCHKYSKNVAWFNVSLGKNRMTIVCLLQNWLLRSFRISILYDSNILKMDFTIKQKMKAKYQCEYQLYTSNYSQKYSVRAWASTVTNLKLGQFNHWLQPNGEVIFTFAPVNMCDEYAQ